MTRSSEIDNYNPTNEFIDRLFYGFGFLCFTIGWYELVPATLLRSAI